MATTASAVLTSGSEYPFPVATYRSFRLRSMVGDDQMVAPEGP